MTYPSSVYWRYPERASRRHINQNIEIDPMETHQRFKSVVFLRLRFVGLLLGQNIFSDDFKIYGYTIVSLLMASSTILSCIWSCLYYDGDKRVDAGALFSVPLKVSRSMLGWRLRDQNRVAK